MVGRAHITIIRNAPRPLVAIARRAVVAMALLTAGSFAPTVDAQILPSLGGDRAGTSGFQFLKIAVDPRGAAMGESVVANASDGAAMFWNPALATMTDRLQVTGSHVAYFADINMEFAAAAYRFRESNIALGLSLQMLSSGDMDVTTEFQPFGTGESFQFRDLAAGLTFAQSLTDLFSYGITSKLVRESTAGISTTTAVFDLGVLYRVGDTGASMGVVVRNFGIDGKPSGEIDRIVIGENQVVTEDDFDNITPPTTFLLGFSYRLLQGSASSDLLVSAQLNNPNDNAENWNLGVEYTWSDLLILRAGYRFGVEEFDVPSFGVGLNIPYAGPELRFDYGFNRLSRLGSVHRVGLNVSIN